MHSFVLGAVVLIAVICILYAYYLPPRASTRGNESTYPNLLRAQEIQYLAPIERKLLDRCKRVNSVIRGNNWLIIPLESDENDIFLADIFVTSEDDDNGAWIKAAVDTGSEALVIASHNCQAFGGCAENVHGTIAGDPNKINHTMHYGSQTDKVERKQISVKMLAWLNTCDPEDNDAALTNTDTPKHDPVCIGGTVEAAVVHEREGTSDYNILGLGAQSSRSAISAFLHSMLPMPHEFAIHIPSRKHARLVLHKSDITCQSPKYKFNVHQDERRSHHHILKIKKIQAYREKYDKPGVRLTGTAKNIDMGAGKKRIDRLLLDTGANAMSLPPHIYNALKDVSRKGTLGITLTDVENRNVELTFPYNFNDRENQQVLNIDSNKIIIGVTFMVGYAIGVHHSDFNERHMTVDFLT